MGAAASILRDPQIAAGPNSIIRPLSSHARASSPSDPSSSPSPPTSTAFTRYAARTFAAAPHADPDRWRTRHVFLCFVLISLITNAMHHLWMIVLFYSVLCVVATLHVTRSVDAVQAPVLDWVRRRTLDAETYEEVRPHDVVPADPEGERDYYAGYQAGRDVAEQRKVVDIWRDVARRGERRPSGCCVS